MLPTSGDMHDYGDGLSGFWLFLMKWNPFSSHKAVPNMTEISQQLIFVAACRQVNRVKSLADLYIIPPVEAYTTLDFKKIVEIRELGYNTAKERVKEWLKGLQFAAGNNSWLKFSIRSAQISSDGCVATK